MRSGSFIEVGTQILALGLLGTSLQSTATSFDPGRKAAGQQEPQQPLATTRSTAEVPLQRTTQPSAQPPPTPASHPTIRPATSQAAHRTVLPTRRPADIEKDGKAGSAASDKRDASVTRGSGHRHDDGSANQGGAAGGLGMAEDRREAERRQRDEEA
ncbi:uncharacterized protein LOC121404575 [Drosophila obscura]|uniref:uncharacterized protein LOC121404575 n=1 Tax=Drosophila obscura TaxID=7282 RepID=UPI001BB2479A|nr:uncharacterized protein LOC121404575 [Drosophila obscura]